MSVQEEFNKVAARVRDAKPNDAIPLEEKLKVYALYKQATVGDVEGSQPWMVQYEARLKWDAWAALKGTSKEEAMKRYIEEVAKQDKAYPSN